MKVSVAILSFNHEKFIAQTLDSILSQTVAFDYEIVVHDDASTDGTVEILKQYQRNYPDKFKLILQDVNQFSLGNPLYDNLLPHCQGEYIAICEGDDYWGDDKKLSIQVAYLDKHPSVFISGHDAKIVDEHGQVKTESKLPKQYQKDFSGLEMKKGLAWLLTGTWVFRNKPIPKVLERRRVINGDAFLLILFGQYGGSHHHSDIKPAFYRVHSSSIWSSRTTKQQQLSAINTLYWCFHYYSRVKEPELAMFFEKKLLRLSIKGSSLLMIIKEGFIKLCFLRQLKNLISK